MLQAGDKVKVKNFADLALDRFVDEYGSVEIDGIEFIDDMRVYCGKDVTIKESPYKQYSRVYGIEEDNNEFIWVEDMFEIQ